ncbi:hypothetical protein EDB86DRAFT_1532461 [Lactarius hatsudake]|nr:hypothetical protein EDB86DRAFT_1532461 [Lactarius hatsudake]
MNVYEHWKGGATLPTKQVAQSGLLWSYPCKCPVQTRLPCSRRHFLDALPTTVYSSSFIWRQAPPLCVQTSRCRRCRFTFLSLHKLTAMEVCNGLSIPFILTFFCHCLCRVQSIWQLAHSCGAAACCWFGIRVPGPAGEPRNSYVAGPTP